jgi:hypothetical protein
MERLAGWQGRYEREGEGGKSGDRQLNFLGQPLF